MYRISISHSPLPLPRISTIVQPSPFDLFKKYLIPFPPFKKRSRNNEEYTSVVPHVFLHIPARITTVYFSRTERHPSWLGSLLESFLETTGSRFA